MNAGVGPSGELTAHVRVGAPPVPCPCVVRLTAIAGAEAATAPVTVVGAPTSGGAGGAAELPAVVRALVVKDLTIQDTGSWTSWFGASPQRQLTVTLLNSGSVAVDSPPMVMSAGKGGDPTGSVAVPALGSLQPGESRTYTVPFELGAFAFGSYTIRGSIPGLAQPLEFAGHTSSHPWGLILIPVVAVGQWLLLRGRDRVRSRIAAESGPPMATLALEAGPPLERTAQPESEVHAMTASEAHVAQPSDVPPDEPVDPLDEVLLAAAAFRPKIADDPERLVEVVTRETVDALLVVVGDRLLTRGEIWSMADAVSAEVGEETAAWAEMGEDERRWLVRRLRTAIDEALVNRPLHEDHAPVPAASA